jgi:hypothetical protein
VSNVEQVEDTVAEDDAGPALSGSLELGVEGSRVENWARQHGIVPEY